MSSLIGEILKIFREGSQQPRVTIFEQLKDIFIELSDSLQQLVVQKVISLKNIEKVISEAIHLEQNPIEEILVEEGSSLLRTHKSTTREAILVQNEYQEVIQKNMDINHLVESKEEIVEENKEKLEDNSISADNTVIHSKHIVASMGVASQIDAAQTNLRQMEKIDVPAKPKHIQDHLEVFDELDQQMEAEQLRKIAKPEIEYFDRKEFNGPKVEIAEIHQIEVGQLRKVVKPDTEYFDRKEFNGPKVEIAEIHQIDDNHDLVTPLFAEYHEGIQYEVHQLKQGLVPVIEKLERMHWEEPVIEQVEIQQINVEEVIHFPFQDHLEVLDILNIAEDARMEDQGNVVPVEAQLVPPSAPPLDLVEVPPAPLELADAPLAPPLDLVEEIPSAPPLDLGEIPPAPPLDLGDIPLAPPLDLIAEIPLAPAPPLDLAQIQGNQGGSPEKPKLALHLDKPMLKFGNEDLIQKYAQMKEMAAAKKAQGLENPVEKPKAVYDENGFGNALAKLKDGINKEFIEKEMDSPKGEVDDNEWADAPLAPSPAPIENVVVNVEKPVVERPHQVVEIQKAETLPEVVGSNPPNEQGGFGFFAAVKGIFQKLRNFVAGDDHDESDSDNADQYRSEAVLETTSNDDHDTTGHSEVVKTTTVPVMAVEIVSDIHHEVAHFG